MSNKITKRQQGIEWMKNDNIETTEENVSIFFQQTINAELRGLNFRNAYLYAYIKHMDNEARRSIDGNK